MEFFFCLGYFLNYNCYLIALIIIFLLEKEILHLFIFAIITKGFLIKIDLTRVQKIIS